MDTNELEDLKINITEEIAAAIGDLSDEKKMFIRAIQPPESIIQLAAEAAASVLMAFERGYRMD